MEKAAAPRESAKIQVAYGEGLGELERAIQKAIAYRAYELYSQRGRSPGNDLEDWFRAESDLIKPADVQIEDAGREWIVQARLPGFSAGEIKVGAATHKVIIWGVGVHHSSTAAQYPQQMLGEIELPSAASPEKSGATLTGDLLKVRVPKEEPASPKGNELKR